MPKSISFSPKNPQQRKLCSDLAVERCLAKRVLCICNIILAHPLFANIPREETHKLTAIADLVKFGKGEHLFLKGSSIEYIYFVLEGKVKLYSSGDISDQVFISQIANVGDALALESLFSELEYFTDSAELLEDSTILLLSKTKFKKIILQTPVIMQNLLEFISEQVISLQDRLKTQVLIDVPERLLKFLEWQSLIAGSSEITLGISKSDLASMLGTIPATLSRAIGKLEKQKYISCEKNNFTLL